MGGEGNEYAGPRICPVCALVGPADWWPTHARFGHRVCPRCMFEGLGSVIPIDHTPESERHVLAEIAAAEAFRKLWLTLASIPPEACGNPRHSGWGRTFRLANPLVAEFNAAVSEARSISGILAPVAEARIQAAETLVAELIDHLDARRSDRLPGLLAMECIRVSNSLRNLAAMTATMPAAVRNWLTAHYLADPTPGQWQLADDAEPEPVVFVCYEDFAGFLVGAGVELLPNLDDWKNAGWIEDVFVDLTPSDEPNESPPYAIARLNLPLGRHRLVGIRRTVLDAPTEPARPNAAPPSTSAPPTGTQQGEGEKPPADTDADRPGRDSNKPGGDRQADILAATRAARMPLMRPELIAAMKLKTEGKLGGNLAWMVANRILINIPQRGYWPAGEPVPE